MGQFRDLPLGINPLQELLLKAATLPADEAIPFWIEWKHKQRITSADPGEGGSLPGNFRLLDYDSQRLLPLVYQNLEHSGDQVVDSLRGNYRFNALKGKYLLSNAAKVTEALQKAGFDVMLLKGMPIALLYYKNLGVRPMDDIDILLPLHQIEEAITFLSQTFNLTVNPHENELRKLGMFHAIHFTDGKSLDFDLHSHFHIYNLNSESDRPMWADKIPLPLTRGVVTSTLSPTHQLYRNFTHGYPWLLTDTPIRWVPDSLIILKESPELIDWSGLLKLAHSQHFTIPVREMLRYLKDHFHAEFPAHVDDQLNNIQVSAGEKHYFSLLLKASRQKGNEWRYFFNKISRIFLRYYLYQERDIRDVFPKWLYKRIKYTRILKQLHAN